MWAYNTRQGMLYREENCFKFPPLLEMLLRKHLAQDKITIEARSIIISSKRLNKYIDIILTLNVLLLELHVKWYLESQVWSESFQYPEAPKISWLDSIISFFKRVTLINEDRSLTIIMQKY